ncbi:hypothetical protein llap_1023 [Limosa lapponica baueri]|uniref:Uncharacterized protein n=1 Tax=Limosa lapponica baueri TaxID=1758121 RepID=A0A2I0URN0_LIMLA|nr:hypothetical protein llap_1023 [Limosa lapponica baueri]
MASVLDSSRSILELALALSDMGEASSASLQLYESSPKKHKEDYDRSHASMKMDNWDTLKNSVTDSKVIQQVLRQADETVSEVDGKLAELLCLKDCDQWHKVQLQAPLVSEPPIE